MAKSAAMNIQDSFLNQVRKDGTEVKISLLDGSTLVGTVRGFDNFTVVLHSRNAHHLLYKHAIAQIVSRRAPRGRDAQEDARPEPRSESGSESRPAAEAKGETRAESKKEKPGEVFNPIDLSGIHTGKESGQ